MERDGLVKCIEKLRADGRALEGDGFGYIGNLKSAYKKATKALDDLVAVIDARPEEKKPVIVANENPDCLGHGSDNVAGCVCRTICSRSYEKGCPQPLLGEQPRQLGSENDFPSPYR